ncbi:MAG TPA: hypothetical protein VL197_08545 [Nitrospirota bacterium]|nr:hypothetical protein [Nitrospirota bacterium]
MIEGSQELTARMSTEKLPIGVLLLANNSILLQDLEFALEHQKFSRQLLGEILVNMGAAEKEDIDRALTLQKNGSD